MGKIEGYIGQSTSVDQDVVVIDKIMGISTPMKKDRYVFLMV